LAGKNPRQEMERPATLKEAERLLILNTNNLKHLQLTTILCCGIELFYFVVENHPLRGWSEFNGFAS